MAKLDTKLMQLPKGKTYRLVSYIFYIPAHKVERSINGCHLYLYKNLTKGTHLI